MKLRVRGDSIRLRVTRGELDALAAGRAVEERVRFPGGAALVYRLRVGADPERFAARFDGGVVEVLMPAGEARRWFSPTEVGVRGEVPIDDGAVLTVLVEKDFPCLTTRPGEDDADAFPWPERSTPPKC